MCGALKRARLVHPGVAEVVFVKKDDAITAYKKYNNRCLDGESEKAATSLPLLTATAGQQAFSASFPCSGWRHPGAVPTPHYFGQQPTAHPSPAVGGGILCTRSRQGGESLGGAELPAPVPQPWVSPGLAPKLASREHLFHGWSS